MKNKLTLQKEDYLKLVGDGAIADSETADGRLIPVLILDTTEKKQLENLVKTQEETGTGDVTSIWAVKRFNNEHVTLALFFKSPIEFRLAISFQTSKHSSLIEGIISSRAVYIQPGASGDKVSENINAPKIIVEIPAKTTFEKWDAMFEKAVMKKIKNEGVRGKKLKEATQEHISIIKEIWGKRLKR